jgi:hypothetical protein
MAVGAEQDALPHFLPRPLERTSHPVVCKVKSLPPGINVMERKCADVAVISTNEATTASL